MPKPNPPTAQLVASGENRSTWRVQWPSNMRGQGRAYLAEMDHVTGEMRLLTAARRQPVSPVVLASIQTAARQAVEAEAPKHRVQLVKSAGKERQGTGPRKPPSVPYGERNQGRKSLPEEERTTQRSCRLKPSGWEKFMELGGNAWLAGAVELAHAELQRATAQIPQKKDKP